jgi:hypothetical protein
VAVIEALLLQYDRVVIDTSGLVSSAKTVVFQICDDLFFVVNRDASAAFANRQALSLIAGLLRPEANLTTVLNDNGVGTASIGLLKEQVVVIAGRSVNYMTVPRSAQGAAWACSGSTPYRALRRTITAGLSNPKNPPVSSRGNQVLNSFKVILVAFSLLIASFCKLLGVRIKAKPKTSASRDPWGSQPTLATNPLLSLGGALPEEGALISKPVMLG